LIFTDEQIQQLAAFDDKMAEVRLRVEHAGQEIAIKFLPIIDKLIKIFEDKLIPAAEAVIDKISEWIDEYLAMDPKQQDMILGAIALTAALGPIAVGIGEITIALANLAKGGAVSAATISGYFAVIAAGIWATIEAQKNWSKTFGQDYGKDSINVVVGGANLALPTTWATIPMGTDEQKQRYADKMKAANSAYKPQTTPRSSTNSTKFSTGRKSALAEAEKRARMAAAMPDYARDAMNKQTKAAKDSVKGTADAVSDVDMALKAYFDSLGNGATKTKTTVDKLKDSIMKVVDAIKEQTKAFFSFGDAFEQIDTKIISGDRLFIRLQKRMKAMSEWTSGLSTLEKRGVSKEGINQLRGEGPDAIGKLKGILQMSDARLKEYFAGIKSLQDTAGVEAGKYVTATIDTDLPKDVLDSLRNIGPDIVSSLNKFIAMSGEKLMEYLIAYGNKPTVKPKVEQPTIKKPNIKASDAKTFMAPIPESANMLKGTQTSIGTPQTKFASAEPLGTKIDKQFIINVTGSKQDAKANATAIARELRIVGYRV
jgi:hypothetical protein